MKNLKYIILYLVLYIFTQVGKSQSCLPDGIVFETQEQVDKFPINYPGCKVIEGGVIIGLPTSASNITNLKGLSQIESIGQTLSIQFNNNLKWLADWNNLTHIGGSLEVIFNNKLKGLYGLEHVTSLGGFLRIGANSDLIGLGGLNNIVDIGGRVSIWGDVSLVNLNGLKNLTTIGNGLSISENYALLNLDGLGNLSAINGNLYIVNDTNLTNIDGLSNVDPNTIFQNPFSGFAISIFNNSKLSDCNVASVCGVLSMDSIPVNIHDNAVGCNSAEEIDCPKEISGTIFYDSNQNQIQDSTEFGISNQKIRFDDPIGQDVFSWGSGKFVQFCDTGVIYNFHWVPNPAWSLTTDSASFSVFYEQGNANNSDYNFGLYPNFSEHSAAISLTSDQTRCNTEVDFFLHAQNTGTFIESGMIFLHYDSTTTFVSMSPALNYTLDAIQHTISWPFDSIYPFQYQDFILKFKVPDENGVGDRLLYHGKMYNSNLGLVEFDYQPLVQCSFTPDDKLVMPPGVQAKNYTLHDQTLSYTIHFQNTGNETAFDVRILDTIDANLDMSTFRVVNSSFPVQTSIEDNVVNFLFKNIRLSSSSSNEFMSHGFITYEISPELDLLDDTKITNTAYVGFDFSPSIGTNTTINTMVTSIPVSLQEVPIGQIIIQPNPASDVIHISLMNQDLIDKVLVYNYLGRLVFETKSKDVNISHLPKGIYFVKVEVGDDAVLGKLVID